MIGSEDLLTEDGKNPSSDPLLFYFWGIFWGEIIIL